MSKRSIIEIDVHDEKWSKFMESFDAYEKALGDMPEEWRKIGQTLGHVGGVFGDGAKEVMKILEGSAANLSEMGQNIKNATHGMNQFSRSASVAKSGLGGLARDAKSIAKTIFSMGAGLFKLAGIGSILGILGAPFLLGESAYRRQKESLGLGMTPGQVSAFDVHMSPFVSNPKSVLETAANAKNDISKWPWLAAMGIDVGRAIKKNPEDLSFEMINNARSIWKRAGETGQQTIQYAEARGLTQMGFSLDDLRRLASISRPQLMAAETSARADAGALGFSRKVGDEWTNLVVTLKKAGAEIESVLIRGLAPLAPEFAKFATDMAADFVKFVQSRGFHKVIGDIKTDLLGLEKFLQSKKVQGDLKDFASAVMEVTHDILSSGRLLHDLNPLNGIPDLFSGLGTLAKEGSWFLTPDSFTSRAKDKDKSQEIKSYLQGHDDLKGSGKVKEGVSSSGSGFNSLRTPRPNTIPKIHLRVTVPAGMGVERQTNASAP